MTFYARIKRTKLHRFFLSLSRLLELGLLWAPVSANKYLILSYLVSLSALHARPLLCSIKFLCRAYAHNFHYSFFFCKNKVGFWMFEVRLLFIKTNIANTMARRLNAAWSGFCVIWCWWCWQEYELRGCRYSLASYWVHNIPPDSIHHSCVALFKVNETKWCAMHDAVSHLARRSV